MALMAVRTIGRSSQHYTVADLEGMPDDGRRYELSYGALIVTPAPNVRHQAIAAEITIALGNQRPPGKLIVAGAELLHRPDVVKIPDVMVADEASIAERRITGTADLVVEIHSPSTRVLDLTEKRAVYAAAGVPAYWLVDPDAHTITVLELQEGAYVEVAVVGATDVVEVTVPFPVRIEGPALFH